MLNGGRLMLLDLAAERLQQAGECESHVLRESLTRISRELERAAFAGLYRVTVVFDDVELASVSHFIDRLDAEVCAYEESQFPGYSAHIEAL